MTWSDSTSQFIRTTGIKATDPNYTGILADFAQSYANRYQLILAKMANYRTQKPYTATTVATTQYYSYPVGMVNFETVIVTVGSLSYPLTVINSQFTWDSLNSIPFQPTTFPRFVFPRMDDFGIWPIPQGAYPITFNYHWRDRSLSVADYTAGTVAVDSTTAIVTGTATTFTPAMVGRWFTVTDTTEPGQGYWYRILSYQSATQVTLFRTWQGTTGSAFTYRIGETPELPEEMHIIPVHGAIADFFANIKNDETSSAKWENRFWTGSPDNSSRNFGDSTIIGGLIGAMSKYEDRNESRLIDRKPQLGPLTEKAFAIHLS